MKVLYIITSSHAYYLKRRDFGKEMMIPVILDAVTSLIQDFDVDVYLVLGYNLSLTHQQTLQQALPHSVGLQVWNDALPYTYECRPDQVKCLGRGKGQTMVPRNQSCIKFQFLTLARQHRFVVKDKLPYYDFFMAYEDDMRVYQTSCTSTFDHHERIATVTNLSTSRTQ